MSIWIDRPLVRWETDESPRVEFTTGSAFSREASDDDPPFRPLRPVGFTTTTKEPLLWDGDDA